MKIHQLYGKDARALRPSVKMFMPSIIGVEVELEHFHTDTMDEVRDNGLWAWKEDHSLRNNGMEFVTIGNGLSADKAHEAIHFLCEWAKDSDFSEGYPRAGIHTHIDCSDLDVARGDLSNLMKASIITESVVFSWVGEWRKWCGFSDMVFSSEDNRSVLSELFTRREFTGRGFRNLIHRYHRYAGTNLQSLNTFCTIEHRQLGTTFDADKIVDWINFNLRIKAFSMRTNHDDVMHIIHDATPYEACVLIIGDMADQLAEHIDERKVRTAMKSIAFLTAERKFKPNWASINHLNPILSTKGA